VQMYFIFILGMFSSTSNW